MGTENDLPTRESAPEALARLFHETYERLAPGYGYETRRESAVPWEEVPAKNRALMVAVCGVVLTRQGFPPHVHLPLLREALRGLAADGHCYGSRPCETCARMSAALGEPFGCDLYRGEPGRGGGNG